MAIGKALIAKVLGGLAVVGTGSYMTYEYRENMLSKYDWALIDFLDKNKGGANSDIKFSVKNASNQDLSDSNFPGFDSSTSEVNVSVEVSVSTSDTTALTEGDNPYGKKATLQNLNGEGEGNGTAWTWICTLKFTRPTTQTSLTEMADKNKLIASSGNDAFFNKLKEKGNKDLKIKFIKNCAGERGGNFIFNNNRKINAESSLKAEIAGSLTEANKIKSEKTFELVSNNETSPKLIFKSPSEFNTWFK